MEKRYQVCVSSTYSDLRNERRGIIQALMEMDCIPAGMELFPAADEEQFEFIKRVIDDCDYYILIIAGRYGSIAPDGISYSEKEYDYARMKGIPVLSFVHRNPNTLDTEKCDRDPDVIARLERFRRKVTAGKLVKMWSEPEGLPGLVAVSLSKTINTHPAVGWVRSDQAVEARLAAQINELRQRVDNFLRRTHSAIVETRRAAMVLINQLSQANPSGAEASAAVADSLEAVGEVLIALNEEEAAQRTGRPQSVSQSVILALRNLEAMRAQLAQASANIGAEGDIFRPLDTVLAGCKAVFGLWRES